MSRVGDVSGSGLAASVVLGDGFGAVIVVFTLHDLGPTSLISAKEAEETGSAVSGI